VGPRTRGASTSLLALSIVVVALLAAVVANAYLTARSSRSVADTSAAPPTLAIAESPSPAVAAPSSSSASLTPSASPDPVLIGAGDIATCGARNDEATVALLEAHAGTVFTAGDNAYEHGSPAEFRDCYDPSWGRVKDRTLLPAPGNHDYETGGAAGYLGYFGTAAEPDGSTWYSRDIGAWHVVVLDANCAEPKVGCGPNSRQVRWLRADLAASDARCTLAIWHQPRFSSGQHGDDPSVAGLWDALYAARADVVVNGHDHDYERFAPQDPGGHADPANGITEIVAGTGGAELRPFATRAANSVAGTDSMYGVLQLTLGATGWESRFLPVGGGARDEATGTCQ